MPTPPTPQVHDAARLYPGDRPRAIVLTFDNLGEATALERGSWDSTVPLGADPSVTEALPRLLDLLDELGLRATFFVEAVNRELYPDSLRAIADRGHELGVHGWRHEPWRDLTPERERTLLQHATAVFASLGLPPRAFRPPGGGVTAATPGLLRELGYEWCSPEGQTASFHDGLAWVPFEWELVDAYHLMESFAPTRGRRGDGATPLAPGATADRLSGALAGGRGAQTLILHPFLMLDEAWWDGARRVLEQVAGLARDGKAWTVPGGELAAWLRERAR